MKLRRTLAGSAILLAAAAGQVSAQRAAGASAGAPVIVEARGDLFAARNTTFQLGVAALWPVSPFLSVGGVVGAGVTRGPAAAGDESVSGRAELVARFTPDVAPTARWRLYGQATAGVLAVRGKTGRALVSVSMGVERTSVGPVRPAVELGLGGGLRVAVALRHAR